MANILLSLGLPAYADPGLQGAGKGDGSMCAPRSPQCMADIPPSPGPLSYADLGLQEGGKAGSVLCVRQVFPQAWLTLRHPSAAELRRPSNESTEAAATTKRTPEAQRPQ